MKEIVTFLLRALGAVLCICVAVLCLFFMLAYYGTAWALIPVVPGCISFGLAIKCMIDATETEGNEDDESSNSQPTEIKKAV